MLQINRRQALAGAAAVLAAPAVHTQGVFPNQLVRFTIPFSAGSSTDIMGRLIAQALTLRWNQQVIVENKPGPAGTGSIATSPNDGYNILLTSNGHTVLKAVSSAITFDPVTSFSPVGRVCIAPTFLIAPPNSPFSTVSDLIAYAKANPGKLNYGTAGIGSATGIGTELIKKIAGLDILMVPFRGMPESQTSVMRGDTAMAFSFYNVSGELIKAGQLKALAVTGEKRMPLLPNVPTFAEAGLPQFKYDAWFGCLVAAGTPDPIVAEINKALNAVLAQPDVISKLEAQGLIISSSTPEEFGDEIKANVAAYGPLMSASRG
jgi:tripartite-type tricarboxylate transporter receptor subunit TctC